MAEPSRQDKTFQVDDLVAIKQRLRQGSLDAEDLQRLEAIVVSVERATAALRAAVVE